MAKNESSNQYDKPVEKAYLPFSLKDLPKIVKKKEDERPECISVQDLQKCITINLDKTDQKDVKNMLVKYTGELKTTFEKAKMHGWKVVFYVNGGRYVSTL